MDFSRSFFIEQTAPNYQGPNAPKKVHALADKYTIAHSGVAKEIKHAESQLAVMMDEL